MEWMFPLEKEKANWLTKRNELDAEQATELDEQFKTAFEDQSGKLLQ